MSDPDRIPPVPDQLREQTLEANEDIPYVISARIDALLLTTERGIGLKSGILEAFRVKSNEITAEIISKYEADQAAGIEQAPLYYNNLLERELVKLRSTFDRILAMSGRDKEESPADRAPGISDDDEKISTTRELRDFLAGDYAQLRAYDVVGSFKEAELTAEGVGEAIPPTLIALAEKIYNEETLTEADWEVIEMHMRDLIALSTSSPQEAYRDSGQFAGFILLEKMNEATKLETMERILDDPQSHDLIVTFVYTNYLTVAQGVKLAKEGLDRFPERAQEFTEALEKIQSDEMATAKAEFAEAQDDALRYLERNFPQNYAGSFLSLEGLLGWFILKNFGLWTIVGNIIASKGNLFELSTNPAFWAGVGITAGSAEWFTGKGGFGTGAVSAWFYRITGDHETEVIEEELIERMTGVRELLGSEEHLEDFYLDHADIFAKACADNDRASRPISDFTFEGLGIDYDSLDSRYKQIPQEDLEEYSRQIASIMYRSEEGLALKTGEAQRRFIEDNPEELINEPEE